MFTGMALSLYCLAPAPRGPADFQRADSCTMESPFIGRERLISRILELLATSGRERRASAQFIWGPHGLGKSALLGEVRRRLLATSGAPLVIELHPAPANGYSAVSSFLHVRTDAASRPLAAWIQGWKQRQAENPAVPLPAFAGAATALAVSPWVELAQHLLETEPQTRLVFLFDDIDRWPPAAVADLQEQVILPLAEVADLRPRLDVILTGSSVSSGDQFFELTWSSAIPHVHKHALLPLTEDEARRLALTMGAPADNLPTLLAQAEGSPGRIRELVDASAPVPRTEAAERLDGAMKGLDPRLRRLLYAASFLDQLCADGLSALLRQKIDHEQVDVVRFHLASHIPGYSGQPELPEYIRLGVRQWCEAQPNLGLPKVDAATANNLNQILRTFPQERVRRQLRWFLPFRFFTRDLLLRIFPREGGELFEFVQANLGLFALTEDQAYQLAPAYQAVLSEYARLLQYRTDDAILARLREAWAARRHELEAQQQAAQEALSAHEKTLETVEKDLSELDGRHAQERDRVAAIRQRQAHMRAQAAPPPRQSRISLGSVLLEVGGIVCLYVSILFSSTLNPIYFCVGVALIGLGIFSAIQRRPEPQPIAPPLPVETPESMRAEQSLRLVDLRLNSLRFRRSDLLVKIKTAQLNLQRAELALQEPYIAE